MVTTKANETLPSVRKLSNKKIVYHIWQEPASLIFYVDL